MDKALINFISDIEDDQEYKDFSYKMMIYSIIQQFKQGKNISDKQKKVLEIYLFKKNNDQQEYFNPMWDCND